MDRNARDGQVLHSLHAQRGIAQAVLREQHVELTLLAMQREVIEDDGLDQQIDVAGRRRRRGLDRAVGTEMTDLDVTLRRQRIATERLRLTRSLNSRWSQSFTYESSPSVTP